MPSPAFAKLRHPSELLLARACCGIAVVWVAAASSFGCGAHGVAAPVADDRLQAPPRYAEPNVAPARPNELARLIARVSAARGLQARVIPGLVALSAAELTGRALEEIRRNTPEPLRSAHAQVLLRLELVPADFEWLAAMEQVLAGRLHAFYDPTSQTIFVDRALVGSARQRALAHELVHALQDQHHALGQRLAYAPDAWDRQSALHALAEGDAEALVARLQLPYAEAEPTRPHWQDVPFPERAAPGVLLRSLAAVYEDGRAFVEPLLERSTWSAVDAAFADPPRTTHELLHAEQRRAPEPAYAPPRTIAPDDNWTLTYTDVLGEQSWRTVLEEWLPRAVAGRAASGWAGDRLSLFERHGARALVWELRSDAAAHELAWRAIQERFRAPTQRAATAAPGSGHRFECRAHRDHGVVAAQSDGQRLWLMSLGDEQTDASCHALANWAERLKVPKRTTTRVHDTSSVEADPGRETVSIPPE